jgi:hypothetical protein
MIVAPDAAVQTIASADIGEFDQSPQMNGIPNVFPPNLVGPLFK